MKINYPLAMSQGETLKNIIYLLVVFVLLTTLSACSNNDPGPLAGSWEIKNPIMPMALQFRSGETEVMGIIEKVSYKIDGKSVLVTYKDGMMKGSSMRYRFVDNNTVSNGMGLMYRTK